MRKVHCLACTVVDSLVRAERPFSCLQAPVTASLQASATVLAPIFSEAGKESVDSKDDREVLNRSLPLDKHCTNVVTVKRGGPFSAVGRMIPSHQGGSHSKLAWSHGLFSQPCPGWGFPSFPHVGGPGPLPRF